MAWGGDDWSWWLRNDRQGQPSAPAQFELLHEILANVPGRDLKTVAHVGRASASCLQFLSTHFADVAQIDRAVERVSPLRSAPGILDAGVPPQTLEIIGPPGRRFDIVLAIDTLARSDVCDLDAVLDRVRGCIVEGGLLLATFPAAQKQSVAREMRLRNGDSRLASLQLHEIELQYRLRRAGFRGVRIRRILDMTQAGVERGESLLCLAVRRANN